MKHYALIFRSTRMLTAEEVKQRHVEISSWVEPVTDMGHNARSAEFHRGSSEPLRATKRDYLARGIKRPDARHNRFL